MSSCRGNGARFSGCWWGTSDMRTLWFAGLAGEPLAPWDPLCGEKEIPARTLHCRMEELNKSNLN